jgi:L-alanine-DL-glutamate epimerase-like enolase superfamily enzyme
MKIVDVTTQSFRYQSRTVRDSEGHTHPGQPHEATQHLVTIKTDAGAEGYCFGSTGVRPGPEVIRLLVKPLLVGEDPFDREKIWRHLNAMQRGNRAALTDRIIGVVDQALWDLAGRALDLPVHKLLGGYRTKVKAYASTMCGDELESGLNSPRAYADFAVTCQARGYTAFKIHTRMPPIPGTPNPREDVAICAAVRGAVGPEMALMLDCFHWYTREEAYSIGKELERLNFAWLEEPMDEHNTTSYVWLAENLTIPVVGPESAEGQLYTRAEWIRQRAADVSRAGVADVGGITPVMKIAHLCEAFGVRLELHGPGAGNLQCLAAMGIPGEYYERGLLHPFLDYEVQTPWLKAIDDPLDGEGYVHVSPRPGLGQDVDWDYIREHAVER